MNAMGMALAMLILGVAPAIISGMVNLASLKIVRLSMAVSATIKEHVVKVIKQTTTLVLVSATGPTLESTVARSIALHQDQTATFRGMVCIGHKNVMATAHATMILGAVIVILAMVD